MKRLIYFFYLFIIAITFSCSSTKIKSSWRSPEKTVMIHQLKKVLVVAFFKSANNRRKAEDQMIKYLTGSGIASYKYLTDDFNLKNDIAIKDQITKDGFDGAVTMRLVDVDKEQVFNQNNAFLFSKENGNFSAYYLKMYPNYSSVGFYSMTKKFSVEINVFSLKENRIVWSGITETINPEGVNKMTSEISKVIYKKMIQEGFISED